MNKNCKKKYGKGNPYKRSENSSWYIYYDVFDIKTNKKKQVRKGGYKTKQLAQFALTEIRHNLFDNNILPSKMTLKDYLNEWLEGKKPYIRATTYAGYKVNIDKHISPMIGQIRLCDLSVDLISKFYKLELQENSRADNIKGKLSNASVLYIHRVLRAALNDAVIKKYIPQNYAHFANKPNKEEYYPTVYTLDELILLLEKVKGTEMEPAIALGGLCGLRRGEVLGLKWSDINFETNTIFINKQITRAGNKIIECEPKTKSGKRFLTMPDIVADILKRYKVIQINMLSTKLDASNGYVITNSNDEPIEPTAFYRMYEKTLKKCGFKKTRFHDLRHSNSTILMNLGVPDKEISERLGHSDVNITHIYQHPNIETDKKVADKIDEEIFKIKKSTKQFHK